MTAETMIRQPRPLTEKYRRVPILDLVEPKDGYMRVIKDSWWHVTDNNEVLFYQVRERGLHWNSPQCNRDKRIVESLPIEGCTPLQIPIVFVPYRWES